MQLRDPTTLIVIDEADRLRMASLDQVCAIFDAGELGVILIGMPGFEKRLVCYPQFYSRVGFVHEFRLLSVAQIRQLLELRWTPPRVNLPSSGGLKKPLPPSLALTWVKGTFLHGIPTTCFDSFDSMDAK